MYPSPFEYYEAEDVDHAVDLLTAHADRDVELMAGGHSLLPTMKSGLSNPDVVVDVVGIDDLYGITHDDATSHVGAMTNYATIADDDVLNEETVLAETAAEIGDVQVRNMGTIGGNIAHADPAADLPAAVLVSDATIHTHGPDGSRAVPAADFFTGMFATALDEDELLTGIEVPRLGADDTAAYVKEPNPSSGYALVGVAAVIETDGETVTSARIGANGAFDHAVRLDSVEEALSGSSVDDDDLAQRAAGRTSDDVDPSLLMEDETASSEFRAHLLEVYTERAIDEALAGL